MPRKKSKGNGPRQLRSELENVTLVLVEAEEVLPVVKLRLEQALRRTGLESLLGPALEELQRAAQAVREAKDLLSDKVKEFKE